jgi:predicted transcriptional regulator
MNKKQKQISEQIITLLKARRTANRKDIGKQIGEGQYSNKLKSHLNYLASGKYIQKLSEDIYGITPRGEKFVSFDEENEIEKLQIENLRLQNKLLKNRLFYAIMGGVIGFVLANWKDILIMLQLIDK